MKQWPPLTETGDLPTGIHRATLTEVLERFGQSSRRRMVLGRRIRHIYELVQQTSWLARLILYGSFITNKLEPNDVDIFLLMEDNFDMGKIVGEAAVLFDHLAA